MNEVPNLIDEVERKALNTIAIVVADRDAGKINKAQFGYASDVIWYALAGLVGGDFTSLMEQMSKEVVRDSSYFSRTYMRDPKGAILKITNQMNGIVTVEAFQSGDMEPPKVKSFSFRDLPNTMKAAREKELSLIDAFYKVGFEEF